MIKAREDYYTGSNIATLGSDTRKIVDFKNLERIITTRKNRRLNLEKIITTTRKIVDFKNLEKL